MPSNTPTIRSVKPLLGGPSSAFEPVIRKQNKRTYATTTTTLIKSHNERSNAFLCARSLFRTNNKICCVVI